MPRFACAILLALLSAAPHGARADDSTTPPAGPAVDPVVSQMLERVAPADLRAIDTRLVSFGTRNLFSEDSRVRGRGVYAARDWLASQFVALAKRSGGRMTVGLDTYAQPKTAHTPRAVETSSVYATLRGDDPARGTYVISSHYDSRNSDGNDATRDAPGADDNGSGTSAVVEAARAMAATHFKATIVFACFDGEEQGLFGSQHFANVLAAKRIHVDGNFNNDIIGASAGHGGEQNPSDVRLFSEALPSDARAERVNALGTENDSPARELARFTREVDGAYVPSMHVNMVYRADRFLRGGDQESFAAAGFPAIRFVEQHENFDHQHQNVRVENGVQYGDLLQYVDFDYLARVTRLNLAAVATLALAPAAPVARLSNKELGYDSTLAWDPVPGAASYRIVWRETSEPAWTHVRDVGNVVTATLPVSKDDYIMGVRAVDAAGHSSVATYPVPTR